VTKRVPLGITDFEKLITGDYLYIDKTELIRDVVTSGAEVLLLPRPRRFGKTLNMSMIRCFLESGRDPSLFDGLRVMGDERARELQGRFPVIFLSFKDAKQDDWEQCQAHIADLVSEQYRAHFHRFEGLKLNAREREKIEALTEGRADPATLNRSILTLSELLNRAMEQPVVILLDEYDTPIHQGFSKGYLEQILGLMRNLLGSALKDNSHLFKGVVTGIMRVSKESIFSDLNNLTVMSILETPFSQHFGFTEAEITDLFIGRGLDTHLEEARAWYNGYRFGNHTVYNPWSILQFLANPVDGPRPYWVNTSSNTLIHDLITSRGAFPMDALEQLLRGESIRVPLNSSMNFRDFGVDRESVYNLMTFSGYLTARSVGLEDGIGIYELSIPNTEIRSFFRSTVAKWLRQTFGEDRLEKMLAALLVGEIDTFRHELQYLTETVLSYHDLAGETPERVFHVFVLGLLIRLSSRYHVRSNRETGFGRVDILLEPKNSQDPGFVFELKSERTKDPDEAAGAALAQIRERDYINELRARGIQNITLIGVALKGKQIGLAYESTDHAN